jgi:hypothetical protein
MLPTVPLTVRDRTDLRAEHMSKGNIMYWGEVIVAGQGHIEDPGTHSLSFTNAIGASGGVELWNDHLDSPTDARCRILKVHRSPICAATGQLVFITTALLLSSAADARGSLLGWSPQRGEDIARPKTTSTRPAPELAGRKGPA